MNKQIKPWLMAIIVTMTSSLAMDAVAKSKNGFDLSQGLVPAEQIFQGGPPREGIPSIDRPKFVSAKEVNFLSDGDRILGFELQGEARAYPISILNWHEIINDDIAGRAIVITFCPLCGTGMAFDSQVGHQRLQFGVSGLLYQSDVLLYDRQTESLWSQVMGKAVNGDYKGQALVQLPLLHTTWQDWLQQHPDTKVLSTDTGYHRDYGRSPYGRYEVSPRIIFEVNNQAPAIYHPKEQVLGIEVNGLYKAYPFKELSLQGRKKFTDNVAGEKLVIHWNELSRSAFATDAKGNSRVTTTAFWFAWYTFHPESLVYKSPR